MKEERKVVVRGASMMVAMIIGAGIFGVPYLYAQSGLVSGMVLTIGVGLAVLAFHLIFAELFLRTREQHRLPGLAREYLGKTGEWIAFGSDILGFWGVLLAYLIVGGTFLQLLLGSLFPNVSLTVFQLAFYALGALGVAFSLKRLARFEVPLIAFMVLAVIFIVARNAFSVDPQAISSVLRGVNGWWLAYGVLVFALTGAAAVPEVRDLVRRRERLLAPAVIWGTVISLLMVLAFGLSVVSVTGLATTEDALAGLAATLGNGVVTVGILFGLIAVLTSVFVSGEYLQGVFQYDLKIPEGWSWLLGMAPPLLLFFLGATSFIQVISLVGAVFVGLDAVLICLMTLRARRTCNRQPEYIAPIPNWALVVLAAVFVVGAVSEIVGLAR